MAKAKITATELASHMGLKKGHGKTLKPLCDAAKDVVIAYAQQDWTSPSGKQALLQPLSAAAKRHPEPDDMMTGLPLQVRYFCMVAKEGVAA